MTKSKSIEELIKEMDTLSPLHTTTSGSTNTDTYSYIEYPTKNILDIITELEKGINNKLNNPSNMQRTMLLEQAKRLDKLSKLITKHYMTSLLTSKK